ncbi:hypothetical protein D3C81_1377120 [compost metagenome]
MVVEYLAGCFDPARYPVRAVYRISLPESAHRSPPFGRWNWGVERQRFRVLFRDRQHEFFDMSYARLRIVRPKHRTREVTDPRGAGFADSRTAGGVDNPELLHNVQAG